MGNAAREPPDALHPVRAKEFAFEYFAVGDVRDHREQNGLRADLQGLDGKQHRAKFAGLRANFRLVIPQPFFRLQAAERELAFLGPSPDMQFTHGAADQLGPRVSENLTQLAVYLEHPAFARAVSDPDGR